MSWDRDSKESHLSPFQRLERDLRRHYEYVSENIEAIACVIAREACSVFEKLQENKESKTALGFDSFKNNFTSKLKELYAHESSPFLITLRTACVYALYAKNYACNIAEMQKIRRQFDFSEASSEHKALWLHWQIQEKKYADLADHAFYQVYSEAEKAGLILLAKAKRINLWSREVGRLCAEDDKGLTDTLAFRPLDILLGKYSRIDSSMRDRGADLYSTILNYKNNDVIGRRMMDARSRYLVQRGLENGAVFALHTHKNLILNNFSWREEILMLLGEMKSLKILVYEDEKEVGAPSEYAFSKEEFNGDALKALRVVRRVKKEDMPTAHEPMERNPFPTITHAIDRWKEKIRTTLSTKNPILRWVHYKETMSTPAVAMAPSTQPDELVLSLDFPLAKSRSSQEVMLFDYLKKILRMRDISSVTVGMVGECAASIFHPHDFQQLLLIALQNPAIPSAWFDLFLRENPAYRPNNTDKKQWLIPLPLFSFNGDVLRNVDRNAWKDAVQEEKNACEEKNTSALVKARKKMMRLLGDTKTVHPKITCFELALRRAIDMRMPRDEEIVAILLKRFPLDIFKPAHVKASQDGRHGSLLSLVMEKGSDALRARVRQHVSVCMEDFKSFLPHTLTGHEQKELERVVACNAPFGSPKTLPTQLLSVGCESKMVLLPYVKDIKSGETKVLLARREGEEGYTLCSSGLPIEAPFGFVSSAMLKEKARTMLCKRFPAQATDIKDHEIKEAATLIAPHTRSCFPAVSLFHNLHSLYFPLPPSSVKTQVFCQPVRFAEMFEPSTFTKRDGTKVDYKWVEMSRVLETTASFRLSSER